MNFLIAGYFYSTGGVATDASVPVEDGNADVHGGLFAYARTLSVLGRSAKVDVVLPYASLDGSARLAGTPIQRDIDGLADPRIRLSVNWFGAPALTLPEFRTYRQDWVLGTSLQIVAPLGQYDSDKAVNLGTNRWTVKPEIGVSKSWGIVTTELAAAASIYGDNDNYFGGRRREQDPIYSLQSHLVFDLGRGVWSAIDGTFYSGGQSKIDGVTNRDKQRNTRLGFTFSFPLGRAYSAKIYGSTGTTARTGTDFDTIGAALQFRWGGDGGPTPEPSPEPSPAE